MSRRRIEHPGRALIAVLTLLVAPSLAVGQDRVADWLEARGLDRLLVEHLEADESPDEEASSRLSEAYARLIETEPDETIRADLVARARRLLARMPERSSVPLRIALARIRYLGAQKILERSRVAEVAPEEIERRREEMGSIATQLMVLADELEGRLETARKRRGRAMSDELDRLAKSEGAANLLAGWCWYYRGLEGRDEDLARAQRAFGRLLGGGDSIPDVEDHSVDRKAYEWYASAILGMAMAESTRISPAAARTWFNALRTEGVHESVANVVDGWQLASLLDDGRYAAADQMLDDLERERGATVPVAWLRMAATGGLRGRTTGDRDAIKLYQHALAMLAARGEFAAITALVGAFGLDSIDQRGFVFDYIRGLEHYREAAEAGRRSEEPTKLTKLAAAARDLEAAIRASDAVNYPDAALACRIQLAKTRIDLGEPEVALDLLVEVTPGLSGPNRADAIWWSIVACDRILDQPGSADATPIRDRRASLGRTFLESFPTDERAARLMIQRLVQEEDPAMEDLEILLSLSPDHPAWRTSRERALTGLYRRFRRTTGEERRAAGRRAVEVGRSLEAMRSVEDRIDPVVALRRDRILAEILTSEGMHDRAAAGRILGRLETAGETAGEAGLADEIEYRRLMLDLLDDDFEAAVARLAGMPEDTGPEAKVWSDLAVRQVHATAMRRARSATVPAAIAEAVIVSGDRRFDDVVDDPSEVDWAELLGRSDLLAVAVNLGTAHRAMFRRTNETVHAERAILWFMRALERRPDDRGLLESAAELSASLDERERTIDLWRRILRRADRSSPLWWKAKVGQIEAVAETDPAQASRILEQVRALEPGLGPEPWRTRLLELSEAGTSEAPSTSEGGDG